MDSEKFDDLSRVLGQSASRRSAIGAIAGLAGLAGVSTVEAKTRRRRGKSQVGAEALELSCPRLCALIFPFSRQRQAICVQNCDCIRRCIAPAEPTLKAAAVDPLRQVACLRAVLTDPRVCAPAEF